MSLASILKYADIINSGACWQAKSATTAAVVAVPTTAAILGIQNGEADGGKSYVFLNVGAIQIANGATLASLALIHSIQLIKPATALTSDVTPTCMKPRVGTYGGNAIVDNAPTVVDNSWYPIGKQGLVQLASTFGGNIWEDIQGLIVLPPGGVLALSCIASATSTTVQISAAWFEVNL